MKNKDILDLSSALESITTEGCNAKFKYAIAMNKKIIESTVAILRDTLKPSDEYIRLENERLTICNRYCERDENSNPVMSNGSFVMKSETKEQSDKEIGDFMEKNKNSYDNEIAKSQDITSLLDEETTIDLYKININFVPDAIKQSEMDILTKVGIIIQEQ